MSKVRNEKAVPLKPILKLNTKGKHVEQLQALLIDFGYLNKGSSTEKSEMSLPRDPKLPKCQFGVFDKATSEALSRYQHYYKLKTTGFLDAKTIASLLLPSCGNPDLPSIFDVILSAGFQAAPASYVLFGTRWNRSNIKYKFKNFTPDLNNQVVVNVFREAFLVWSKACSLTFTEVSRGADIDIKFKKNAQGDPIRFKGAGSPNKLAIAFGPVSTGENDRNAGDIYINDYESWTTSNPTSGKDLLTMAVHEIGHSLGLDHSPIVNALMHKHYVAFKSRLTHHDIEGINSLYGPYTPKSTLCDSSIVGPAFIGFNRQAVIAWTGMDNLNRINLMFSNDLRVWFEKRTINSATSRSAPSITVFGGKLYMAWRGVGNNKINVMSSADGQTWRRKITLNETTHFSPSISSYNGKLVVGWTGTDENRSLNIIHSANGRTWNDKITIGDSSVAAPTICPIGNNLLLGWTGTDRSGRINVMKFDGDNWTDKVTLDERSSNGPSLSRINNTIYLSWTGTDRRLNHMRSGNGKVFTRKKTLAETSSYSPAMGEFQNKRITCWTGTDNSSSLNALIV